LETLFFILLIAIVLGLYKLFLIYLESLLKFATINKLGKFKETANEAKYNLAQYLLERNNFYIKCISAIKNFNDIFFNSSLLFLLFILSKMSIYKCLGLSESHNGHYDISFKILIPILYFLVSFFLYTLIYLIFKYYCPKNITPKEPELGLLKYSKVLMFLSKFTGLQRRILYTILNSKKDTSEAKESDIDTENDIISSEERELINSIIDFNNTTVKKVMIPRGNMHCGSITNDFNEILSLINEYGHSRIPIYKDDLDHIEGIIHAKDLLKFANNIKDFTIEKIIRDVIFVPETKDINELLKDFKRLNIYMAIVTDEFGGTSGLITVEDLLEEIVGEIHDEYDKEEVNYTVVNPNELIFNGDTRIDYINEEFKLELPEAEEYETLAGLIFYKLGDVPEVNYTYKIEDKTIEVLEVDNGKILKIKIIIK